MFVLKNTARFGLITTRVDTRNRITLPWVPQADERVPDRLVPLHSPSEAERDLDGLAANYVSVFGNRRTSKNLRKAAVGFEPTMAYASGFAIRPLGPLGHTACVSIALYAFLFVRRPHESSLFGQ